MKDHVIISIRITVVLLVITCGIYPLAIWAIGQVAFHHEANGSLITRDGKVIGSELIGQEFTGESYFHARSSASSYDPMSSGGTNLGPTSKKLRDAIAANALAFDVRDAPPDAVTSSASGLDPHISPANAMAQAGRVARANGLSLGRVQQMIRAHTENRFIGIFGEPRVNVLLLNIDVHAASERHQPP